MGASSDLPSQEGVGPRRPTTTSYLHDAPQPSPTAFNFICRKNLMPLSHWHRYAVFGLGSSMYPEFCAFAHMVYQKLQHLGACPIVPTGEGDELNGQEEAFRVWAVATFKVTTITLTIITSNNRFDPWAEMLCLALPCILNIRPWRLLLECIF